MDQQVPLSAPATLDKGRGPTSKIANSLVALSSAAVLTVYAAGYLRTRTAAARFAVVEAADGRTVAPVAGPPAPAAAPRAFEDVAKLTAATPAVPGSPVPKSVASAPPSGIVPAEPSPAAIAESSPTPTPAPTAEATAASSATPTPTPAPAAVDSATAEPPSAPPARKEGQYKDGTYSGWGYSRHGDIQAAVVVQDGRVVSAEITQCLTRYSCSVIDTLPPQVLSRQNAFVDLISGATESANAFSNAIYRALALSK
jgi:uncharacterized protein with FMN-binding domain